MDSVNKPLCRTRDCILELREREAQVRRGDRVVEVTRSYWQCDRCRDPDDGGPLDFVDYPLAQLNEAAAEAAWSARFGESLPRPARPGRKPKEEPIHRVTVVFSESELSELDALRGTRPRGEFIRSTVLETKRKSSSRARDRHPVAIRR